VDLDKNISYYYKLEEIDLDDSGKNPMYGPIGPVSETLGASQQENTPRSTNSDDSGCFIKSLKQP
jgi:hypothetical protein